MGCGDGSPIQVAVGTVTDAVVGCGTKQGLVVCNMIGVFGRGLAPQCRPLTAGRTLRDAWGWLIVATCVQTDGTLSCEHDAYNRSTALRRQLALNRATCPSTWHARGPFSAQRRKTKYVSLMFARRSETRIVAALKGGKYVAHMLASRGMFAAQGQAMMRPSRST